MENEGRRGRWRRMERKEKKEKRNNNNNNQKQIKPRCEPTNVMNGPQSGGNMAINHQHSEGNGNRITPFNQWRRGSESRRQGRADDNAQKRNGIGASPCEIRQTQKKTAHQKKKETNNEFHTERQSQLGTIRLHPVKLG